MTRVKPDIQCEADYFHLVQAVMRQIKKNGDLETYRRDLDFFEQVCALLRYSFPYGLLPLGQVARRADVRPAG